jgi:hypothetical protein
VACEDVGGRAVSPPAGGLGASGSTI